ncbi:hypothetical protein M8J77_000464 [Diaphorina citri]|nr:hypothetical protein M8J77_010478 [Diaphorina citri]KAI5714474.1 hypothetical protein M8J77_000464 [Diaphorina citri]
MRIGHTRLTHSYLFTRTPHPTCRCGDILTVKHILTCPLDRALRSSLPNPPSLSDDTTGIDALMSLLKSLNYIDKILITTSSAIPFPLAMPRDELAGFRSEATEFS